MQVSPTQKQPTLRDHVFKFCEALVNMQRATTQEAQQFATSIAVEAFRNCFLSMVKEGLAMAIKARDVPQSEASTVSK
jgi:hypothetical protein